MTELLGAVDVRVVPHLGKHCAVVRATKVRDDAGLRLDRSVQLGEGVCGLV